MSFQDLGFTVTRNIPDSVVFAVLKGTCEVCGGIVRTKAGQIVTQLLNGTSPLNLLVSQIGGAVNRCQLHRIGSDVAQTETGADGLKQAAATIGAATIGSATKNLISLSTGTMALSGLTLAVSAAGFAFLNKKLDTINSRLQVLSQNVKEIKDFLSMQQKAQLATALNTLINEVAHAPNAETRSKFLVECKMMLGVLYFHYKAQFEQGGNDGVVSASEEYFTITALAHALCAGELDMYDIAAGNITDAYSCWSNTCRKVAKEKLLRADPQRFIGQRYAEAIKTDELIDWMEFAHADEKGIGWIDELRAKPNVGGKGPLSAKEQLEVDLFKRLTARDRVFKGYCSQYQYFKDKKIRPSAYQNLLDQIDKSEMVDGTYILIANQIANPKQAR